MSTAHVTSIAHAMRTLCGDPQQAAPGLDENEAELLMSAVLDGGLQDLELGALLGALAMKQIDGPELAGFSRAAQMRLNGLRAPNGLQPVVIPSYGGAALQPNLMPLVALMLARFGVPTVVHGALESAGRIPGAAVFRQLGILPATSVAAVETALAEARIAFVPTGVIAPGLAQMISLRARLGVENCAINTARLIDPFGGAGTLLVPCDEHTGPETLAEAIEARCLNALLFLGTEGEAYTDPHQRPEIRRFRNGAPQMLFEAEYGSVSDTGLRAAHLPAECDARSTARWTLLALAGRVALPPPIANLLACCLFAAGYSEDFNQAKAIVAMRAYATATT